MGKDQRQNTRFQDFGKVDAPDICVFPGILADISYYGCKIRFPVNIDLDMESDYEIKITPTRKNLIQPFVLIVHPQWIQSESDSTEIGFRVLHSPGSKKLVQYIKQRAEIENDAGDFFDEDDSLPVRQSTSNFYSAAELASL